MRIRFFRINLPIFVVGNAMKAGIELYLEGVLESVGVVSIPGIGTFRRDVQSAQLDASGERMLPPQIVVSYSPQIEQAWLLPTQLSSGLQLSEEEAQTLSAQIVRLMRQELNHAGRYEWAGVGVLTVKPEGGYHFEAVPATLSTFAGDYYGLRPVEAPDLPVKALSVSQVETQNAMNQSGASQPKRSRGIGWKSFLLLLLLPTLGLGLVEYGPFHKQRSSITQGVMVRLDAPAQEPETESFFTEEEAAPTAESSFAETPADSESAMPAEPSGSIASNDMPSEVDQEPTPADYATKNNARVAQPTMRTRGMPSADESTARGTGENLSVLDTAGRSQSRIVQSRGTAPIHHLILGSFSTQAAAVAFAKTKQAEGHSPTIISPEEGSSQTFRVSVYRNRDLRVVQRYAERLKAEGVQAGWILTLPR